jgi:hypothetical protein
MTFALIVLFAVLLLVAACTSPEATRTRGGGPGADVGNRTRNVHMHEGSKPFAKTPQLIPVQKKTASPTTGQSDQAGRK